MMKILVVASLGLALFLPQAKADQYDFSYTFNGNTLEGKMDGILQGDNNTVVVNSTPDFTFNCAAGPSLPTVRNADNFYSVLYPEFYPIQPGFPLETRPLVTLDGNYMNFLVCPLGNCDDSFTINAGNSLSSEELFDGPFFVAGSSYGFTHTDYVQADWQMSVVSVGPWT